MFKQLKLFIVGLVVVVLFVGAVVYFLLDTALNATIERTVEVRGTRLLGAEVAVEKVSLSTFAGKGRIDGFQIASPDGYPAPYALRVKIMDLQVDTDTFSGRKIILDRIHIHAPHVIFVQGLTGNNLQTLLANLEANVDRIERSVEQETDKNKAPSQSIEPLPIRFGVRELDIDSGRVGLGVSGEQLAVPLGQIRDRNLGMEGEGLTAAELAEEILVRILRPSLMVVATGAAEESLRRIGGAVDGLLGRPSADEK